MSGIRDHFPTKELKQRITDLCVAGIPLNLICEIVNLDDDTVRKHYKRELTVSEPVAVERVASTIVMQALAGNEKSQALYMKTKGAKFGWVEKQVVENVSSEETQELKDKLKELEDKFVRDY